MVFSIKQHDSGRPVSDTLTLDGAPLDLRGATVTFVMRHTEGGIPVRRLADLVNAAAGQVRYVLTSQDTNRTGLYDIEWSVLLSDGSTLTLPSDLNRPQIHIYPVL